MATAGSPTITAFYSDGLLSRPCEQSPAKLPSVSIAVSTFHRPSLYEEIPPQNIYRALPRPYVGWKNMERCFIVSGATTLSMKTSLSSSCDVSCSMRPRRCHVRMYAEPLVAQKKRHQIKTSMMKAKPPIGPYCVISSASCLAG